MIDVAKGKATLPRVLTALKKIEVILQSDDIEEISDWFGGELIFYSLISEGLTCRKSVKLWQDELPWNKQLLWQLVQGMGVAKVCQQNRALMGCRQHNRALMLAKTRRYCNNSQGTATPVCCILK